MSEPVIIRVKDFTTTPGSRFVWEGKFSGEEFRTTALYPAYEKARASNIDLVVDLDGTRGYASSFLEEAFGGLVRLGADKSYLLSRLTIISNDRPRWKDKVREYIERAKAE